METNPPNTQEQQLPQYEAESPEALNRQLAVLAAAQGVEQILELQLAAEARRNGEIVVNVAAMPGIIAYSQN